MDTGNILTTGNIIMIAIISVLVVAGLAASLITITLRNIRETDGQTPQWPVSWPESPVNLPPQRASLPESQEDVPQRRVESSQTPEDVPQRRVEPSQSPENVPQQRASVPQSQERQSH